MTALMGTVTDMRWTIQCHQSVGFIHLHALTVYTKGESESMNNMYVLISMSIFLYANIDAACLHTLR